MSSLTQMIRQIGDLCLRYEKQTLCPAKYCMKNLPDRSISVDCLKTSRSGYLKSKGEVTDPPFHFPSTKKQRQLHTHDRDRTIAACFHTKLFRRIFLEIGEFVSHSSSTRFKSWTARVVVRNSSVGLNH
jgi:hypothetical protein